MTLMTPTHPRAAPLASPPPARPARRIRTPRPVAVAPTPAASITTPQLARLSGTPVADLKELVDYGVLSPSNPDSHDWTFALPEVRVLQRAEALRQDLALDAHAFALAVMLLKQITALEWQLQAARTRMVLLSVTASVDQPDH